MITGIVKIIVSKPFLKIIAITKLNKNDNPTKQTGDKNLNKIAHREYNPYPPIKIVINKHNNKMLIKLLI